MLNTNLFIIKIKKYLYTILFTRVYIYQFILLLYELNKISSSIILKYK